MTTWTRRAWLRGLSASLLAVGTRGLQAHVGAGPVDQPLPTLDAWVLDQAGKRRRLREMLQGNVVALQTMFTGCSSICPLQGALFAEVQRGLPRVQRRRPVRLLSLSIDPLGDSPDALGKWLQRMGAGPSWQAVVPTAGLDQIRTTLGGREPDPNPDRHSTQVYFINQQAQLCWRSTMLPSTGEVLRILEALSRA